MDAVSVLASPKSEGEERKFQFLSEHLKQQGELRQKELELEREWLEIEREKNWGEQRKRELMMMQLQGALGLRSRKGRGVTVADEMSTGDEEELSGADVIELEDS